MNKVEVEIRLKIRFYDSFFFGGGTGGGEIQSYLLRDIDGFPYISGSALKGCIAEYAAALAGIAPAFRNGSRIFGTGGTGHGTMYFENGTLVDKTNYHGMQEDMMSLRTGVSINPYTKAKSEGQLYTMELGGMGGGMVFRSSIYGFLDEETCQRDIAHLVAAVRMVFALGGKRTAGPGWLDAPIECQVFLGRRDMEEEAFGENTSGQEQVDPEILNRWIREYMGQRECTQ